MKSVLFRLIALLSLCFFGPMAFADISDCDSSDVAGKFTRPSNTSPFNYSETTRFMNDCIIAFGTAYSSSPTSLPEKTQIKAKPSDLGVITSNLQKGIHTDGTDEDILVAAKKFGEAAEVCRTDTSYGTPPPARSSTALRFQDLCEKATSLAKIEPKPLNVATMGIASISDPAAKRCTSADNASLLDCGKSCNAGNDCTLSHMEFTGDDKHLNKWLGIAKRCAASPTQSECTSSEAQCMLNTPRNKVYEVCLGKADPTKALTGDPENSDKDYTETEDENARVASRGGVDDGTSVNDKDVDNISNMASNLANRMFRNFEFERSRPSGATQVPGVDSATDLDAGANIASARGASGEVSPAVGGRTFDPRARFPMPQGGNAPRDANQSAGTGGSAPFTGGPGGGGAGGITPPPNNQQAGNAKPGGRRGVPKSLSQINVGKDNFMSADKKTTPGATTNRAVAKLDPKYRRQIARNQEDMAAKKARLTGDLRTGAAGAGKNMRELVIEASFYESKTTRYMDLVESGDHL